MTNFDFKIENLLYEKAHTKFMKIVLGVSKYASNLAVLGDLGRFPVSIKAFALTLKYWHIMVTGETPNILLGQAFLSETELTSPWLQSIQYLLTVNAIYGIIPVVCLNHKSIVSSRGVSKINLFKTGSYMQTAAQALAS